MEFISGFIQSSEASCSIAVRKKKNVTEKMNQNKVAFSLSSLWRLPFLSPSNNPAAAVVGMDQGSSRELNLPSKNIIIHQVLDAADMTIDLRKNPRLAPVTSGLKG